LKVTEWLACRLAHRVFCVSESLRQEALRWNLCSPEKMQVVHNGSGNGVDAKNRFNPARYDRGAVRKKLEIPIEAPVLGFVGRMARDKGIVDLARSWGELSALRPNLQWIIIGDLDTRDEMPQEIQRRLRADPRVHMLGFVRDVAQWYSAMDVCVLPTYREGFPNVLLEAAAMSLPVVATQVTGCVDAVVDGVTGTLVPPRDAQALGSAIARYLDDPKLRQQHGEAARKRVIRDFRPTDIWSALCREYEVLLHPDADWSAEATARYGAKKAA
jgi:glycosyltransferase involved in cell wall biosynthesis